MQWQMSSASASTSPAPEVAPSLTPRAPGLVRPAPRKPSRMRWWWLFALGLVAVAIILYFWPSEQSSRSGGAAGTAAVRSARVTVGGLDRTIRISGSIAAERFAALMTPRLRGRRGGGGSTTGSNPSTAVASVSTGTSSSIASSSSTGSSSSSSASNSSSTSASSSGSSQTATSSLGALRGTTNRFSDSSAVRGGSSTPSSASSSSSSGSSSSTGSSGLGSTSGSLLSGGGGGGGGSEFNLVLLNLAKPGSMVKKGDVVAEFDRQYQINLLDDHHAQVVQRQATIKKLMADQAVYRESHAQLVAVAKADLDKALLDMKTAEVRSAIEAETLKLTVEESQARYKQILSEVSLVEQQLTAQLKANEIDLKQSQIDYQRAEANIERMVLKAPIDGIMVMQTTFRGGEMGQVQVGDLLHPGQIFVQIVDPSSMVLNAVVNQADSEALRIGMKAKAHLDAYPRLELAAHITGLGAMSKPGMWRPDYMREVPVKLKLDNMDPRVIPDLSASADVILAGEQQATIAPLASIFTEPQGGTPFVFLRTPGGFERRDVELGLRSNIAVVVSSGLKKDDVVAVERPVVGGRK